MKKLFIYSLLFVGLASSCTKDFADYNTDKKNPVEVKGEFLFSSAQKEFADQMSSTSVNLNVFKMFVQYWTETTYIDEANYDIQTRKIPDNNYSTFYRSVITPLNQAAEKIGAGGTGAVVDNKLAIIDLMKVFTYHELVNSFGDIPYTESNDIENISPKYDDALAIYKDLLVRIDKDLAKMDASVASYSDGADLIYDGDVAKWIKFANSLKLKIAINAADDNGIDSQKIVNDVMGKVFDSADDNMLFQYQSTQPNTNPMFVSLVASGRKDFVPANTLVDLMNTKTDPRMDAYFTDKVGGVYKGGRYGYSNSYPASSHISDKVQEATFPGILMTYSEVQFYLAEAADRGYISDAAGYYKKAIEASFDFWGVTGADAYVTANPYNGINDIAYESWVAAYTRGDIAYTTYRRLDWPLMNAPQEASTVDGKVPRRLTYPINEQTLNKDNYDAAAAKIGGDKMETLLFWDTKAPGDSNPQS
jgi:hypothetical protein